MSVVSSIWTHLVPAPVQAFRPSIGIYGRIARQVRGCWLQLGCISLLSLFSVLLALLLPLPLKIVVDSVLGELPAPWYLSALLPGSLENSAGMLAAARCAELGRQTVLLEKNAELQRAQFAGLVEARTTLGGHDAIIPSIEGWARITGYNTIFLDDRDREHYAGYSLGMRQRLAIAATLADANGLAQQVTGLGYAVRALQELPVLGFTLLRLGLPAGLDVPAALTALRQAFPATLFDANTLYEPDAASSANAEPRHYAKALIGWPDGDTACGAAVSLGLVDTAVDRRHRALQGQDVQDRSFIAAGVPPAPPDHGTAVAALLVGAPGDTAAGLLPAARLYAAAIFADRKSVV